MRIVCFGDSITFGEFVDRKDTWVDMLACETGHDVVNRGVCAETTRLALERAGRDLRRDPPDVLLIQFGLNDLNRWDSEGGLCRVSAVAFEANLLELVSKAVHWGTPSGRVVLLGLTTTGDEDLNVLVPVYDLAVHSAAIHHGAWFVSCLEIGKDHDDLHEDGVHLSPVGHRRYFENLLPHLAGVADEAVVR